MLQYRVREIICNLENNRDQLISFLFSLCSWNDWKKIFKYQNIKSLIMTLINNTDFVQLAIDKTNASNLIKYWYTQKAKRGGMGKENGR